MNQSSAGQANNSISGRRYAPPLMLIISRTAFARKR